MLIHKYIIKEKRITKYVILSILLFTILVLNSLQEEHDEKQTPAKFSMCTKYGKFTSICKHLIYQPVDISDLINHTIIPFLHNGTNKAKVSHGECMKEVIKSTSNTIKLTIITNFIYKSMDESNFSHVKQENARIWEILSTLQHNLNHWSVKTVYLFVELETSVQFLKTGL